MGSSDYFYLNEAGERIIKRVPPGYYLFNKVTGKVFPPNSRAGWKGINIDKENSDWEIISIHPVKSPEAQVLNPKIASPNKLSKSFETLEFEPILPILTPLLGEEESKKVVEKLESSYNKTIDTLIETAKSILESFKNLETRDASFSAIRSEKIFFSDTGQTFFVQEFLKDLENLVEHWHGLKGNIFNTKNFSTNSLLLINKRIQNFLYFLSEKFYEKDIIEKKIGSPEKAIDYFLYSRKTQSPIKHPLFLQEVFSFKERLNGINAALKHIDYVLGTILKSSTSSSKNLDKDFIKLLLFENLWSLEEIVDSFDKEAISFPVNEEIGLLDSVKAAVLANVPYLFRDLIDKSSLYIPETLKTTTTDTGTIISFSLQNEDTQTIYEYSIELKKGHEISSSFLYRKLREAHYLKDFYGFLPKLGKKSVPINVTFTRTTISNAGKQTETLEIPLRIEIAGSFVSSGHLQLSAHVKRFKKPQPEKIFSEKKRFKEILDNLDDLYDTSRAALFSGQLIDALYTEKGMDQFGSILEFLSLYPLLKAAKTKIEQTGNYSEAYIEFYKGCLESLYGRKFLLSKDEQEIFEKSIFIDYEDQSVKISLPKLAQLSLIQLDSLYEVYTQERPLAGNKIFDFIFTSNEQSLQELNDINFLKNLFLAQDRCSSFLSKIKDVMKILSDEYYNKLQKNIPLDITEQELYALLIDTGEVSTTLTALASSYRLTDPKKFIKNLYEKLKTITKPKYTKDFVKFIKGQLFEAVAESLFEELISSISSNVFENNNFIAAQTKSGKILIKAKSNKYLTTGFGDIRMYVLNPEESHLVPIFLELKATKPKVQSVYSLKEAYVEFLKLSHNLPEIVKNLRIKAPGKIRVSTVLPLTIGADLQGDSFVVDFSGEDVQSPNFISSYSMGSFRKLISHFVKVRDYGLIGPSIFSSEVEG